MDGRLRAACAAVRELDMLPLERVEHPLVTLVRDAGKPDVWDANHACQVRARTPSEIDEVFALLERELPPSVRHRDVRCDPETPVEFVAALHQRGFEPTVTIQLSLEGPILAATRSLALRRVESDSDWASFGAMARAISVEEARREGREPYSERVSRGLTALKRGSTPAAQLWLAELEGEDVGHVGAWCGRDGVGIVEWVGVVSSRRRQGLASAMVEQAVREVRAAGAATVLIGPLEGPYDAPRRCYEGLGFRPWFVTQRFLRA